jgi:UDPglucose 6-dehydrogenase
MSKHAINAFLGMSVAFSNELATICEKTGANAFEVEKALKSEPRIGPKAYVRPGSAFAGGTLARDIAFLDTLAGRLGIEAPVIHGILPSNSSHRLWSCRRALEALSPEPAGKTVAVLGLSYKPDTDALRRSVAIETIRELLAAGVRIRAYDPAVRHLPPPLAAVTLCASAAEAAHGAKVMVVATGWKEFAALEPSAIVGEMTGRTIIDQDRILDPGFAASAAFDYVTLGTPT